MAAELLFAVLFLLAGAAICAAAARRLRQRSVPVGPQLGGEYAAEGLFDEGRLALYQSLREAFPAHHVLAFVPAHLLLSMRGGARLGLRRDTLRRQVLDFVVVDATGTPSFVFRLGRSSAAAHSAQSREVAFVVWALKQAGISTFRIRHSAGAMTPNRLRAAVGWYTHETHPHFDTSSLRGSLSQDVVYAP